MPLLVASKQQKRNEEGHTPPRRVGKMRKHTYWGWARRPFPCPRHPPHRTSSVVLFSCGMVGVAVVRVVRVARHCRRAVAIVVAVGVVDCQTSPLVTKWEITHVTGHGAGNPKPVPRIRVFGGYGIPTRTHTPEKPAAKPVTFPSNGGHT